MTDNDSAGKPLDRIVPLVPLEGSLELTSEFAGTLTTWLTYPFAEEWFTDALNEARTGTDHNARRREIVFAVSFAESYLVEWIRDQILDKRDFKHLVEAFNRYFPPGTRQRQQPVTEKWKEVPKQLLADGLIQATPDLGKPYWENFKKLVDMRNGLVHARSSRPETGMQPEEERPLPSKGDLDKLSAGWATEVVVLLARKLHHASGTAVPSWLVMP